MDLIAQSLLQINLPAILSIYQDDSVVGVGFIGEQDTARKSATTRRENIHLIFYTFTWNTEVALLPFMRIDKIKSDTGGDLRLDLFHGGAVCDV